MQKADKTEKNMVSVIIISYKRLEVLKETIDSLREDDGFDEVVLVDNCSQDGTKEYGQQMEQEWDKLRFFPLDENKGVAAGRNYAVKQARGDILVFLDDDAIFRKKGYFSEIVSEFEKEEKLGVIAFQIINYYSGEMQRKEIPFRKKTIDLTKRRKASTYIGAGHAIAKKVFEQCGDYPEDFFYGGEELDLSYRVVGKHYEIFYIPDIQVLHKQAASGRVTNEQKWIMTYRNRLVSSYCYLPFYYRCVSAIIWFVKIAVHTRSIKPSLQAIKLFFEKKGELKQIPLDKTAICYLKENYGRLWY